MKEFRVAVEALLTMTVAAKTRAEAMELAKKLVADHAYDPIVHASGDKVACPQVEGFKDFRVWAKEVTDCFVELKPDPKKKQGE